MKSPKNKIRLEKMVSDFLSRLEIKETSLLAWGLVDGAFTENELLSAAKDFRQDLSEDDRYVFDEQFDELFDFLDYIEAGQLIFALPHDRFRTRMSETVRLFAKLKQLFPQHLQGRSWQAAPTLVSDFRFQIRRREIPKRNISPDNVLSLAGKIGVLSDVGMLILKDLLKFETGKPIMLSTFQSRSLECILADFKRTPSRGTIVCSGTGSGKTMAFYLPALARIGDLIDKTNWTKCLAIYPRKELLKDQFSETFRLARRIDQSLSMLARRKLILGAFFGSTPFNGQYLVNAIQRGWEKDWKNTPSGYLCPFMRCPKCNGGLIWRKEDAQIGHEILRCQASCGTVIKEDELVLTRQKMQTTPPDILFTTTEMLNQRMGDSYSRQLFGVGKCLRKPELILLDEVHTYSGIQGAQTAMLLRRWKRASRARPHFVGLSATLRDAKRFFSRLTALNEAQVDEVSPVQQDMEKVGMEYLLALRNDPVSGASVISTTIQASMLLGRILTPRRNSCSGELYGKRVFVFTDDLDVTNRLYYKILDAEGCNSFGRPIPLSARPHGSLANLRRSSLQAHGKRLAWGQSWDLCEEIGHRLQPGDHLEIGRTSSQDSGVSDLADIIIATAALEVGFNDPTVGAIIQHKAPHDMAQFLQRKGRAGRDPRMRPWTVVILSDYGRDRITYQGYDLLFDPELTPRSLPVENRYVLRMQAVYAFMDWISSKLDTSCPGNVWQNFSYPAAKITNSKTREFFQKRQDLAANIIEDILCNEQLREELTSYIKDALRIDDTVLTPILWDPPRALLTAVLPTLLRRLRSGWRLFGKLGCDRQVQNNPLPEFVPSNLFSELNLPEVVVSLPALGRVVDEKEECMGILQALKEFAPGRVSRRFAVEGGIIRHWIEPPGIDGAGDKELPIKSYCSEMEEIGRFQYEEEDTIRSIRCIRPFRLKPQAPPRTVKDTSNARLNWKTQILPSGAGLGVDLPDPSAWGGILEEIRFFTHNQHSHLEVRRFAIGTEATICWENGGETQAYVKFAASGDKNSESIGVGYAIDVDGMLFRFHFPDEIIERSVEDPVLLAALRTARFKDLVREDQELSEITNVFRREWLFQVYLSALINIALTEQVDLNDAWRKLVDADEHVFSDILDIIFQSMPDQDDDDETQEYSERRRQRVQQDLMDMFGNNMVLQRLHVLAPTLWNMPDDSWKTWLEERFKATLGAAVFDATQRLCPDFDAGDLILDLDSGPRGADSDLKNAKCGEIWITETNPGGGGFIEELLARYGEDPRRFLGLIESALEPSDFEVMDMNLSLFLQLLNEDESQGLKVTVGDVRGAHTHTELSKAMKALVQQMTKNGLVVNHSVMVAINARVIRPNSSEATDRLIYDLIKRWKESEVCLGVEIDSRLFAYVSSRTDEIDQALGDVTDISPDQDQRQWRYGAISGLLWPRGQEARSQGLSVRNPFRPIPLPERALVSGHLQGYPKVVNIEEHGWQKKAAEIVGGTGAVVLRSPVKESGRLKSAILSMVSTPVDAGFLFLYPRIRSVKNRSDCTDVLLESSEVLQCHP